MFQVFWNACVYPKQTINLTGPNSKVSGVNLMKPSINSAEKLHHIYLAGLKTDLC